MLKITLFLVLLSEFAFAHGGRTNSEGCHNNRKTGDYHCHGGKLKPKPKKVLLPLECGNKSRCYEMTSCKEVMFYFENCELPDLDRDMDGVPCEKLCGSIGNR